MIKIPCCRCGTVTTVEAVGTVDEVASVSCKFNSVDHNLLLTNNTTIYLYTIKLQNYFNYSPRTIRLANQYYSYIAHKIITGHEPFYHNKS